MRRWVAMLVLWVMLLVPARANAQTQIVFDNLDVAVWPEYDTTSVLVIYKIALAPQTSLPANILMRLPSNVKRTAVVAVGPTAETVSDQNVDYKFVAGSDYSTLSVKANGLFIQVEYYDTSLAKDGKQRKFTYEWPGDYSVNQFRFELRQPLKSANMVTVPVLTSTGVDGDGFEFDEFKQASVPLGQKLTFAIEYQRDTDSPSTSFLQVQSSTPLDQAVPGQSTWTAYLPWIIGGLGLVLLLIAAWVYWTSGRANRTVSRSRKRHTVSNEPSNESGDDQVHCSQCGKRAQPGDRFCRVCGSRIRRSEA